MFKKLTSLLFNEEEIIIEEEIAKQDKEDALKIPELKPIVPQKKQETKPEESKLQMDEISMEDRPVVKKVEPVQTEDTKKKTMMINVDEKKPERKRPDINPQFGVNRDRVYQSQEVISPIYGGTQETTTPIKKTVTDAKKRSSMTQVISPMFGHVTQEDDEDIEKIDEIMDLDITEMLSPERTHEEEVQVSLYDYLEGLEDDNAE